MIMDHPAIISFENAVAKRSIPDYHRNLQVFAAMYQEALSLGVLPLKDPLDGIDSDIHLARVVNVRKTA